jgi:hypothetical protein
MTSKKKKTMKKKKKMATRLKAKKMKTTLLGATPRRTRYFTTPTKSKLLVYGTTLINVRKYQEFLKKYYNKSVVQWELNIRDLVLKKDIRTREKHKFSSPWEGPFIIVDVAAPGAYVLAEVDGAMLPNTWNVDQLRKYYV